MRPSKDEYFLKMAEVVATRSTCVRRSVGCVLVDEQFRVMSTGYNGSPPGMPHCTDHPCDGAHCKSGTGLDLCMSTHAEINALLFCGDVMKIHSIYLTVSPCVQCIKALLTTSAKRLIFREMYASDHTKKALEWWTSQGREYVYAKQPVST